ncbi:MAG: PHP domain-containing protein [Theionarchaea archaeon]|nr:PHP domain-containing protein [Theionarchaea archaeon]MBU7001290.1 PHP domain-containing protein [Theionarchaea archaeon]MBU7021746.1 PHP domain-containing protein [Theionarchaea archaeon]MBU7034513.1 PHP domain-containing protein [Theionarchaea archaeon]MBU7041000.1 PHP domain-containing protein [Theionarchaea archaeon]
MYDLHVHIIGHDTIQRDYSAYIDSYMLQAELLGLEALGFVDHYPYRVKNVQKIREKVEYLKDHADIPVFYGAEIHVPSNTVIPKYFDYSLAHVRQRYSLEEAFTMARQKNIDIIAHPCAYGASCSPCQLEQFKDENICLELSEKALVYLPQWLYEEAQRRHIPLTLGSDAHFPQNMGFPQICERDLAWTSLDEIPFLEGRL